jgi:hypothetical protein
MNNPISKNFEEDLSSFLTGYIKQHKAQYMFQNQEIFPDEIFAVNGFLPMFICDKQMLVSTYLKAVNHVLAPQDQIYAQIHIQPQQGSLLNWTCFVDHNFKEEESLISSDVVYNNLILLIGKNILAQPTFVADGNKVHLDNIFKHFQNCMVDIIKKSYPNYK